MEGLLTYSGLTTKVRAMKRRLIKSFQYRELASLDSVPGAVDYLRRLPAYGPFLSGTDESQLHRSQIEELLLQSKYHDFSKLYRFSTLPQRKFLDLYFMHYEISALKRCLRGVIRQVPVDLNLALFQDFFERHSKLDFIKLSTAKGLEEFTESLAGSPYYAALTRLNRQEGITLFDYEMSLDMIYFHTMWKIKDKKLKRQEREALTQCFGERLDMLNLQWIYRYIQYYHMAPSEICALLIPIFHRLKAEQVSALASAGSVEKFYNLLSTTYYGNRNLMSANWKPDPEALTEQVLDRIHKLTERRDPYSIATVNSYLYFKELEITRIIHIIESIRYGLEPEKILSSVMNA